MKKADRFKKIIRIIAFLSILAVGYLLLNKKFCFHDNSIFSGDARVEAFRELPQDSVEILFLGSSHVMSGINPAVFWDEEQIPSYNLATRAQTFPFTYLLLKEAFKTQHPKVVVIDAFSVTEDNAVYGLANTDEHFSMNMDLVPLSLEKINLIQEYVPYEKRAYCMSSLLTFHSRWNKVFRQQSAKDSIYMGFCFAEREEGVTCSLEMHDIPEQVKSSQIPEVDLEYYHKIVELCEEEGVTPVFIKTPIVARNQVSYEKLQAFSQLLETEGVPFFNYADPKKNREFPYEEYMRDNYHMNSKGANAVTGMLLEDLRENNLLTDTKNTEYAVIWDANSEKIKE